MRYSLLWLFSLFITSQSVAEESHHRWFSGQAEGWFWYKVKPEIIDIDKNKPLPKPEPQVKALRQTVQIELVNLLETGTR